MAGEVVTAAYFNSNVRDAGNFFLGVPIVQLRQTSTQTLTTATITAINMDAEDVDSDSGHSTVTNTSRYTPATAGWFQFSGKVSYAANATGRRGAIWLKNGSVVNGGGVTGPTTAASVCEVCATTIQIQANGTTDYVEIAGFQESGGNLATSVGSSSQPAMSGRWVRGS